MGGHVPCKIRGEHEAWLLARIAAPFTLRGLVAELAERGLKVDYRTVWSFVHRAPLSFNKTPVASERPPHRGDPYTGPLLLIGPPR